MTWAASLPPLPGFVWTFLLFLLGPVHLRSPSLFSAKDTAIGFRTHPHPEPSHLEILNQLHLHRPSLQSRSPSEVLKGHESGKRFSSAHSTGARRPDVFQNLPRCPPWCLRMAVCPLVVPVDGPCEGEGNAMVGTPACACGEKPSVLGRPGLRVCHYPSISGSALVSGPFYV